MPTIAVRLKSERKRLALTQAEMAQRCDISREAWCRYEQEKVLPGSEVLQAFLKTGGNVHFVLSGDSSVEETLSAEEALMIERFRACPKVLQDAVLRVLKTGH